MKKGILILVGILGFFIESKAQELDFRVIINSDRSRFQNTDVFTQMKTSFEQFLNGRTWTSDEFRPEERIKGNLLITINQVPQRGIQCNGSGAGGPPSIWDQLRDSGAELY